MQIALYSSPLIPPEWLAAHGWQPCRWQPAPPLEPAPAGACPFAWAWMEAVRRVPEAGCLVLTTECDMMRRGADEFATRIQRPVFLFNTPATATGELGDDMFRTELERLGRFLTREGGRAPDLACVIETVEKFSAARIELLHSRAAYSPRGFSEAIAALQRGASIPPPAAFPHPQPDATPIALVGGPLMPHHFLILDFIERAGGRVALDATETGELALAPAPDPELLRGDPLSALTRAYLDSVPTVHRRPNGALYRWLEARLKERDVRGILFFHYPWCDPWHGEVGRMKNRAGVPLLPIVLDEAAFGGHNQTRIEAFLESLR